MKRRRILFAIGVTVALAFVWWWMQPAKMSEPLPTTSKPSASEQAVAKLSTSVAPQIQAEKKKAVIKQIEGAFSAPIAFYGRVIDQNGDPVAGASVGYSPVDNFISSNTHYTGASDAGGYFSIENIKGIALSVGVEKQGYYPVSDKYDKSPSSSATFAYGMGPDSYRQSPPTKDKPAIFVLQKKGETVPLVHVSSRQIDVPKTGQPLSIDLATGKTAQGSLQVASWMGESIDPRRYNQRRFDWRYQLSIPGGGLIERKGQFDFEAPSDGYQPAIEINMPANAEKWASQPTKEYFAKLADGRYARFSINFYPGALNGHPEDRNMVVLESYVNPKPGSRNLELDPAKVVKSP